MIVFCVVPIAVYGIQHYVSMLGSLILIPLVIVPAMGGAHVSGFKFFSCYVSLLYGEVVVCVCV